MPSRIQTIFHTLRSNRRAALMPFICAGRPSLAETPRILAAVQSAGAAIVEIGIPFSDPIADGPVIAAAMHLALESGVTPPGVFRAVAEARAQGVTLGLVAMVSVSIVHRIGTRQFVQNANESGFDGFIFPDVPLEEAEPLLAPVRDAGLTASLLVAPTTSPARAEKIAKASTGFVYLLARTGITGEHASGGSGSPALRAGSPTSGLAPRIAQLRTVTDLPIAVGFGISTPDHVRAVIDAGADAAIVGSALVRRIEETAASGGDVPGAVTGFVRALAVTTE